MAKGEIKKLASAWQGKEETWIFSRNTVELGLVAIELERGEGKYLGLVNNDDTSFEVLESITAKSEEVLLDDVIRPLSFKGKVIALFNSTIFRPLWREAVKDYPASVVLTDANKATILKSFEDMLNAEFNAEPGQFGRPKDASYYTRQAAKKKDELVPYLKLKTAGKLTKDDETKVKVIMDDYKALVATAEAKRKEEDDKAKADEDSLLNMLG